MRPAAQRIVLVGGTSAIGLACARRWMLAGRVHLTLLGRDALALDRAAADLRVRHPDSEVVTRPADFHDPVAIQRLAEQIGIEAPQIVLIAQGQLPNQQRCQTDLSVCREALCVNAVSAALYAEAFASRLAEAGGGCLVLIGSVAGDRGRRSNYTYGAAKALLSTYAQGLQHRFHGTGVHVLLVKPGPTDTPMTAHLRLRGGRLAPVEAVATDIVRAVARRQSEVYTPARWRYIMALLRGLPSFIFNRLPI